jgi:hypothetical protein
MDMPQSLSEAILVTTSPEVSKALSIMFNATHPNASKAYLAGWLGLRRVGPGLWGPQS